MSRAPNLKNDEINVVLSSPSLLSRLAIRTSASLLSLVPSGACGEPRRVRLHGRNLRDAKCRGLARFAPPRGGNGDGAAPAAQPSQLRSPHRPITTAAPRQPVETRVRQSVCLCGDTDDSERGSPGPSLTRGSAPPAVVPGAVGSLCPTVSARGDSLLVSCQKRRSLRRSWAR